MVTKDVNTKKNMIATLMNLSFPQITGLILLILVLFNVTVNYQQIIHMALLALDMINNVWKIFYFYIISSFIILLSIFVIVSQNPVYSLLALILVFLKTSTLLLSIDVEFLAMIYVIIYIGAIAILFLFVIMMFSIAKTDQQKYNTTFWRSFIVYLFVAPKFYFVILKYLHIYFNYNAYFSIYTSLKAFNINYFLTYRYTDILVFSNLFYTYYSYLFLLSGILLLAAMIGSIVLALSTIEDTL